MLRKILSPCCLLVLVAAHTAGGCKTRADEERTTAAAIQKLEDDEKARVRSNPDAVLEVTGYAAYDKGIINDYRQVTEMTVLNRSKFALHNMSGDVEWVGKDGRGVGAIPFSLKGSIPAGATVKFTKDAGTLTNGTLQTSAKAARITFRSAAIVD